MISIIMPNYNSFDTITKTINSINAQTYKNWELIIVDDNSDSETKHKLLKLKNKKIKIFFLTFNKGAGFCRNLAIKKAKKKTKFFAFIDSDDTWNKNKLKMQLKFMEKNNYDFSYTYYYTKKKKKKKKIIVPRKFNFDHFIKNTSIATSTMMVKKKIVNRIKFNTLGICEDYIFKCKLLKKIEYAYCLPKYYSSYLIRKNSLQSNRIKNFFWIWKLNKTHNKMNFFKNFISILSISMNSIIKYGLR